MGGVLDQMRGLNWNASSECGTVVSVNLLQPHRLRLCVVLVLAGLFQSVVSVSCDACTRGECRASAGNCCQSPSLSVACPLCRAAGPVGADESEGGTPCRCAWKAKHSLPMNSSRGPAPDLDQACLWILPSQVSAAFVPPVVAGVAQTARVPIPERPARILYGVWRN